MNDDMRECIYLWFALLIEVIEECVHIGMKEWMTRWANGGSVLKLLKNKWRDERMHSVIIRVIDGSYRWMNVWKNVWKKEWMTRWVNAFTYDWP